MFPSEPQHEKSSNATHLDVLPLALKSTHCTPEYAFAAASVQRERMKECSGVLRAAERMPVRQTRGAAHVGFAACSPAVS